MSADFVVNTLEFPKERDKDGSFRTPDWEAAKRHVLELKTGVLINAIAEGSGYGEDFTTVGEDPDEDEINRAVSEILENLTSVVRDENGELRFWNEDMNHLQFIQLIALNAVDACSNMWYGNSEGDHIILSQTLLLVTGGTVIDGDVEGIREMNIFVETGAAKAAGFIV